MDNYLPASSTYTCDQAANSNSYVWYVTPAGAGTTSSTGLSGEFTWTAGFTGTVQVTVVGLNDCGIGEFSDAFTTQVYTSAGLDENAGKLKLSLYPNPASTVLNVKGLSFRLRPQDMGLSSGIPYFIEVYSVSGEKVIMKQVDDINSDILLNVKDLLQGIYTVIIKEDKKVIASGKFIINR